LKDPSAPLSASWSKPAKTGLRLGDSRHLDQFSAEMEMKVFCGTANRALGEEVAAELGFPLGRVTVRRFEDGEIYARFEESVRGVDAFIIQPTCPPVNENLMELLVMVDALRRASAARITAVMPYYGYARQDKKHAPRAPITGRLVADLLQAAGVHRVLALDLDADQIEGFFQIPVDHLRALPLFAEADPTPLGWVVWAQAATMLFALKLPIHWHGTPLDGSVRVLLTYVVPLALLIGFVAVKPGRTVERPVVLSDVEVAA